MHVVHDATESRTHAVGTVNVRGTDPVLGATAEAHGAEVVNNTTDTPLGGHIKVVISGNLEDMDFNTGQTTIVHGTIRCSIHLPYAIGPAPIGQPPDSESVISDADGD